MTVRVVFKVRHSDRDRQETIFARIRAPSMASNPLVRAVTSLTISEFSDLRQCANDSQTSRSFPASPSCYCCPRAYVPVRSNRTAPSCHKQRPQSANRMHKVPSRSPTQHALIAKGCTPVCARVNGIPNRGASARPRIFWRTDMTSWVSRRSCENAKDESTVKDGVRRTTYTLSYIL